MRRPGRGPSLSDFPRLPSIRVLGRLAAIMPLYGGRRRKCSSDKPSSRPSSHSARAWMVSCRCHRSHARCRSFAWKMSAWPTRCSSTFCRGIAPHPGYLQSSRRRKALAAVARKHAGQLVPRSGVVRSGIDWCAGCGFRFGGLPRRIHHRATAAKPLLLDTRRHPNYTARGGPDSARRGGRTGREQDTRDDCGAINHRNRKPRMRLLTGA